MELTPVRIGMMDSRRPEGVATIGVRQLRATERLWRAAKRLIGITGIGLLVGNIALLMLPFPHLHLCLFPVALILGPVIAFFAWRDSVVLGSGAVPCPHCHRDITVPRELYGWPARFNCLECGIRVELNAVR
jgi:hypothetical protein